MSSTPGERFGAHLGRGLTLLWTQGRIAGVRRWARAGENWLDTAVRWAMAGGPPALASWWLLASWWRTLLAVVVVCILALRAATKAAKAAPATAPPATAEADGEDPTPAEFLALAHRVVGTARAVYLKTLAVALSDRYGGAWEIADVRRLCEAARVPVTPTVRAPGGKPTVGVYRAHLPPLPEPLPEGAPVGDVAVVAAGQNTTTGPTTTTPTTPATPTVTQHGGLRIVARDDPHNPARTHVTVTDNTRKRA